MGLEAIYNLGDDQMASHFNILFPNGFPLGGDHVGLILRAESHKVPDEAKGTYKVAFHGLDFEKTGGHSEEKNFDVTFRLPIGWGIYKDMKKWVDMSCHPETGGRMPDLSLRTTIVVQAIDISEDGTETPSRTPIVYKHCKPISIGGLEFDHSKKDEPVKITVKFIYVSKTDEPYTA